MNYPKLGVACSVWWAVVAVLFIFGINSFEVDPGPNAESDGITTWGFGKEFGHFGQRVIVPHWFLTIVFATLACAALLNLKRFTLRTLLIATTLVAVGLWFVVWLQ